MTGIVFTLPPAAQPIVVDPLHVGQPIVSPVPIATMVTIIMDIISKSYCFLID